MRVWIYILLGAGILALVFVLRPTYGGFGRSKIVAAKTQISTFNTALKMFKADTGHYPKSLRDLVERPRDVPNWHGSYLDAATVPPDGWGHAYIYECPGKHNTNTYDLISLGPDGRLETEDDITN